ncbi:type II toxin-antitoxin system VapC family toxin [Sphingomonas japonica]|uniref:PIN domain-containing protein n=1 Tax=Sphingomonas japonica TaxID=511662 RepID=A0ABX0U6R3_9SPHN|nr:type II toxin-antitoxin system VapC family toxin [Sphingomonas japonica]NIJ25106.1 hypothetical protein [Sphingomonas japonica]
MILLDSNVVIDLIEIGSAEGDWARASMEAFADSETFGINLIIRAETASRFRTVDEQSEYFSDIGIESWPIDDVAAWRAGQAFKLYRQRGGARDTILADFLIGGHAAYIGAALMTRDRRLDRYFPELTLITPETHPHG